MKNTKIVGFIVLAMAFSCQTSQQKQEKSALAFDLDKYELQGLNTTTKTDVEKHSPNSNNNQELLKKLEGEWTVLRDWNNDTLYFSNHLAPDYKQEIFPSYNTIVFNPKDKKITVNTYGEFGCGTAARQNLEITNSKWHFENGLLKLYFDYIDYSGTHKINNLYKIQRNNKQLILTKKQFSERK